MILDTKELDAIINLLEWAGRHHGPLTPEQQSILAKATLERTQGKMLTRKALDEIESKDAETRRIAKMADELLRRRSGETVPREDEKPAKPVHVPYISPFDSGEDILASLGLEY